MLQKHFYVTATLVVVLALIAASCGASDTVKDENAGPETGLEVGDTVPDIVFTDLEGNEHKLSDYRGQVVFLNFWATWCGPCRYEMPSMEELYRDHKDEGLVILAISVGGHGETQEGVEKFAKELDLTFPIFIDYNKVAFNKLHKSPGIPETYIIDREGVIRVWAPGARHWNTTDNYKIIRQILGKDD